jgi:hypothetical protein
MPTISPLINLNDLLPAAPSGKSNIKWQADALNPRNVSAYVDSGGGAAGTIFYVGSGPGLYATIDDAITALLAAYTPSFTNPGCIFIYPGTYTMTTQITVPAWTGIVGVQTDMTNLINDTTNMFLMSGNNWFMNFCIQGSATAGLYVFDGNNTNGNWITHVNMYNNGGTAKQLWLKMFGSTWRALLIEHCLVDGWNTSDYLIKLRDTSGTTRFCDVDINDIFFDTWHLTNYGGSIEIQGCQDVRIHNSQIRGSSPKNTGVRLEKYGITGTPHVRISHCYLEGGVPLYNESGTLMNVYNTDAAGSIFAGSSNVHNSYVGAASPTNLSDIVPPPGS